MELNTKQTNVLNTALKLFGTKGEEKKQAIVNKIKISYETELIDYTDEMVKLLLNDVVYDASTENLFTKYVIPPFSVLDTKQGEWRRRKEQIDNYLGSSLVGRSDGLAYGNLQVRKDDNGTSQFDSVLCEVLLKWFGFSGCSVLDPFCGGHVRGSMASLLNYKYMGFDISKEQIDANNKRALELGLDNINWVHDDALNLEKHFKGEADLLFTCPPYGDLEKYSDDPADLSNMPYKQFIQIYTEIIKIACARVRQNRFAVIIVGDFRDEQGFYRSFVGDTINAFVNADFRLYNEMVLLNNIGTAPMRATNGFLNRKVVKVHQNVLVFYKGDPTQIQENYTSVDSALPVRTGKQSAMF